MITDHQYVEFMFKLVADQAGTNRLINMSDRDREFIHSFALSKWPSTWITERRRPWVDSLWLKHGPDLKFPHPLDTVTGPPPVPAADPTGCEYLVKGEDGREARCNAPAVCQGARRGPRAGLRYCEPHAAHVRQRCPGEVIVKL